MHKSVYGLLNCRILTGPRALVKAKGNKIEVHMTNLAAKEAVLSCKTGPIDPSKFGGPYSIFRLFFHYGRFPDILQAESPLKRLRALARQQQPTN
jgi:hypothetical protein